LRNTQMDRQYSTGRGNDSNATQRTEDTYSPNGGSTTHPRRYTEPNTSHHHPKTESPDPDFNNLYRATTIDNWDDRHRQRAAREPMVEYMCDDPVEEQDENEFPIVIPCHKPGCTHGTEDEEASLVIPSTYHYDPSLHLSSLVKAAPSPVLPSSNPTRHSSQTSNPYRYPSPDSASNSDPQSQSPTNTNTNLIDKISAYVLSHSEAARNGPLTPESKRLVNSLSSEILTALRTGEWDRVPVDLVRDVRETLS
jgi:hypothetical protein